MILNHRPSKHKSAAPAEVFRIGEPDKETDIDLSTTKQRTRRTQSTSTQLPLTTFLFTTEAMTTTTPIATTDTILTTITMTSPLTSTDMTQPRLNGQRRRDNMTLYILTSDEHKIRQFSVNHTRGILLNCNQLRRRLLGRRRLRDIFQTTTTTNPPFIIKQPLNSSNQTFHYNILSLIILSFFFLTKLIIIT